MSTRPSSSRPLTPLRRISSHSLRQLSLSHSQQSLSNSQNSRNSQSHSHSTTNDSSSPPSLEHLQSLFQELSDSFIDLSSNLESSSLVCKSLNEFNEGFASYLYGLRINSYTLDFKHSPSHYNFELQNQRRKLQQQQQQQQRETVLIDEQVDDDGETTFTLNGGGNGGGVGDSTFITNDEQSFIIPRPTSSSSSIKRGGGGSSNIARGRGTGRPGLLTKRKKEEISAFADPIFPLLPINLRENRRNECEKVLWALKQHSQGIGLNDLTKHLTQQSPPIPQVRINEVLLALVRAKVATKGLVKGVNLYRLDENRIG